MTAKEIKISNLPLTLTLSRSLVDMGYSTIGQIEADLADLSTRLSPRKLRALMEALDEYYETKNASAEFLEPRLPESVSDAIGDLGYPNLSDALKEEPFRSELARLTPDLINQLALPNRLNNIDRNLHDFFTCSLGLQPTGTAKFLRGKLEAELRDLGLVASFNSDTFLKNQFGISLLPAWRLDNFGSTLEAFESVVEQFLCSCAPSIERVLRLRAFELNPDAFATLEEIAETSGVSRERIRQLEKKGLSSAHDLIFVERLNKRKKLYVREEFSALMGPLTNALKSMKEISLEDLSQVIETTMNVRSENLFRFMALVVPILSGSASGLLASTARQQSETRPLKNIPSEILNLPVSFLRLGRVTESLLEDGIETIEDFHSAHSMQRLDPNGLRFKTLQQLMEIDRNWGHSTGEATLRLSEGLCLYNPTFEWGSGDVGTLQGFIPWLSLCIHEMFTWHDTRAVFVHRTSLPANERMTMTEVLELDGVKAKFQPHIGKLERQIIDRLTTFFVHRDLSKCKVHVPDRVFDLMAKLQLIHTETNNDYELFQVIISHRLDVHQSVVKKSAHLFWAMLSGNLPNRYWHLTQKARTKKDEPVIPAGVVKLRGFRNAY